MTEPHRNLLCVQIPSLALSQLFLLAPGIKCSSDHRQAYIGAPQQLPELAAEGRLPEASFPVFPIEFVEMAVMT